AGPNGACGGEAELVEPAQDGQALRVVDHRLQGDVDARQPHVSLPFQEAPGAAARRRYASRYLRAVCWTTSRGSGGGGGSLFQSLDARKSRTYCLSKLGCGCPG